MWSVRRAVVGASIALGYGVGFAGLAEAEPCNLNPTSASLCISIDGQSTIIPVTVVGDSLILESGPASFATEGGSVQISLSGKLDPTLVFVPAFVDVGAPSSFIFIATLPFVPTLPGPLSVSASLGITMTDGDPASPGISLTPTAPEVDIALFDIDGIPAGVDLGCSMPADANGDPCPLVGTPGGTKVFGPYTASSIFNPGGGPFTMVSVTILVDGTGFDDLYAFTGRIDVNQIPEPGTLGLLGLGLIGLGAARKRKSA